MQIKYPFTKKYKDFFKVPRTMKEVMELIGDAWEANHFQNENLNNNNLKLINCGRYKTIHLVNYDYEVKEIQKMEVVAEKHGYKYLKGVDENGKSFYNVVPADQDEKMVTGGYYGPGGICKLKNVPNLFQ